MIFVEVFVDEEKLRQFVQRFVVVPKFRPMTVLGQYLVAEAVDGRDRQFGKVAGVLHFAGRRSQSVTHLEGGLLGEVCKAQFPLARPCPATEYSKLARQC